MRSQFPHRSEVAVAEPDAAATPAGGRVPPLEFHACCCPGRPLVRVIMPPTAARPHPVDLLLCGHHYRVSRAPAAAAHGTIEVLPGRATDADAALLGKPTVALPGRGGPYPRPVRRWR